MCAGLDVVRLVHEPVAAALAYGLDVEEDQTVLVFDLGGGTYDVSILEVGGGVVEVLATGGDAQLGGNDLDHVLMDWIAKTHLEPQGVFVHKDPELHIRLRSTVVAAKEKLSTEEKVRVVMPVGPMGRTEVVLTRQLLEELSAELFRQLRLPIDQACWQAGIDLGSSTLEGEFRKNGDLRRETDPKRKVPRPTGSARARRSGRPISGNGRRTGISEVILVGGATRMPAVRKFVKNMTGIEPRESLVDPDLAVALGAALQAGIYQGQLGDVLVMDPWKVSE